MKVLFILQTILDKNKGKKVIHASGININNSSRGDNPICNYITETMQRQIQVPRFETDEEIVTFSIL